VRELDAGDLLGLRRLELDSEINAQQLHDKLAVLGSELLHIELMDFVRGNLAATPQDSSGITFAKKIDKMEAEIKWTDLAKHIHNKVRAFVMGPGTYSIFAGKKLKIHQTKVVPGSGTPGQVLAVDEKSLVIATGQDAISLLTVQPESRNRMNISEFLKGYQLKKGDSFGSN
jgi:methionyl-tRNA formyltransferase